MPNTPKPNVTEEIEAPLEALLVDSEVVVFKNYFAAVNALVKAEDTHNLTGIETIEMFEDTRKRFIDTKLCLPKEAPSKVLDTVKALLSTMEFDDKVVKRVHAELKSVHSYYENSLSIRFRALTFTTFAKLVKLHDENNVTMSKSRIKALLNVFKIINGDSTEKQVETANKSYAEKAKNLIIMVEAQNLAGSYDAESVPAGFQPIFEMAKGMDKKAINNMIAGLRVASNEHEGVYKAKTA